MDAAVAFKKMASVPEAVVTTILHDPDTRAAFRIKDDATVLTMPPTPPLELSPSFVHASKEHTTKSVLAVLQDPISTEMIAWCCDTAADPNACPSCPPAGPSRVEVAMAIASIYACTKKAPALAEIFLSKLPKPLHDVMDEARGDIPSLFVPATRLAPSCPDVWLELGLAIGGSESAVVLGRRSDSGALTLVPPTLLQSDGDDGPHELTWQECTDEALRLDPTHARTLSAVASLSIIRALKKHRASPQFGVELLSTTVRVHGKDMQLLEYAGAAYGGDVWDQRTVQSITVLLDQTTARPRRGFPTTAPIIRLTQDSVEYALDQRHLMLRDLQLRSAFTAASSAKEKRGTDASVSRLWMQLATLLMSGDCFVIPVASVLPLLRDIHADAAALLLQDFLDSDGAIVSAADAAPYLRTPGEEGALDIALAPWSGELFTVIGSWNAAVVACSTSPATEGIVSLMAVVATLHGAVNVPCFATPELLGVFAQAGIPVPPRTTPLFVRAIDLHALCVTKDITSFTAWANLLTALGAHFGVDNSKCKTPKAAVEAMLATNRYNEGLVVIHGRKVSPVSAAMFTEVPPKDMEDFNKRCSEVAGYVTDATAAH